MKLVSVADLGLLRAYREIKRLEDHHPHLELIKELEPEAAHEKFSDRVTDQAGRCPRGSGADMTAGDLSSGERLSLDAEETRRLIKRLAETIDTLLADDATRICWLAASAPIHKQLLEALNPVSRTKISRMLPSNIAHADPQDLLEYFSKAASKPHADHASA